eukprot:PhM_4_TR17284/c0_g1_i1/m.9519/K14415/RTCB, rtcB; tRNA-splicing ligase RtcB
MNQKVNKSYFMDMKQDGTRPLWRLEKGAVSGMRVPCIVMTHKTYMEQMLDEVRSYEAGRSAFFTPSLVQVANTACLPGVVKHAMGMPDMHAGYGFAIGNVVGIDCDPAARGVICPGGIGFDINCGVRVIRTNLTVEDLKDGVQEQLTQSLYDHILTGVGSQGIIPTGGKVLENTLNLGMDWAVRQGYAWPEDKEHCEEYGRMMQADASCVSTRAKKRGGPQLATLGAGNHYLEVQVVDEIHDGLGAQYMGLEKGQVVVMLHCGSRGLGHQVATDALVDMEPAMARDGIEVNDKQLACARIDSKEGQHYYKAMSAAANFAFANRSCITFCVRQAFYKTFGMSPDDLDMHVVYDVSHNIGKIEEHIVDGRPKQLMMHRKGTTRAFGPGHPLIPVDYQLVGQPVLIGGSMGTNSWVLMGTQEGMDLTFGTSCHGAGRAQSRAKARHGDAYTDVLDDLRAKNISIRVSSPKMIVEEAPGAYKDVNNVVDVCHDMGISKKVAKLRPLAVIKG